MSTDKEILAALKLEIDDFSNVIDDDDNEDESGSAELYTISSFGVDHTVEGLVKRLRSNQYYIPKFQRKYVWSLIDASKFVESLLLGLPVPGIFLYKETDSQKHLVIDGQQRLKSLQRYYDGLFNEKKFKLSGLKSRWNGLAYADLVEDDRLRLDDAVVHATIFKQDNPNDNMDSVYEVFERINTGGMKLSPQEIRTCVAHGPFNDLLFQLNEAEPWRSIFGLRSIRLKDIELILRFFAFSACLDEYKKPMKTFLTKYMTDHRSLNQTQLDEMRKTWMEAISAVSLALTNRPFRPGGRAMNAALYDCFTVAVARNILEGQTATAAQIQRAYSGLIEDTDFITVISSSTSDEENVKKRFNFAFKYLKDACSS